MEFIIIGAFVGVILLLIVSLLFLSKTQTQDWHLSIKDEIKKLDERSGSKDVIVLRSAVIDCDKLLDHTLKQNGVAGATMGERLTSARNKFEKDFYNKIWRAHKARNKLVHEMDYTPPTKYLQNDYHILRKAIIQLLT